MGHQVIVVSEMVPIDVIANHWLLRLAVHNPVPVRLLFPTVQSDALNVREIPGLVSADYAAAAQRLLDEQALEVVNGDNTVLPDLTCIITELEHLHDAGFQRRELRKIPVMNVALRLTPQGGEVWERLAEPHWDRLVVESSDLSSCELASPDRNTLMAYMGWYSEIHRESLIDLDTVQLTVQAEHPILYWKRSPSVYCAAFKVRTAEPRRESGDSVLSQIWFREWEKWCKDPWDLPGWPPL
jgi:hypothetical protein